MSQPADSTAEHGTVARASGEMAERIRAFDWSRTPMGPAETWSPALRTMVRVMLANRLPMLLWWGPEYVSLYNDPYIPVLGKKHPWALGQPVSECWREIWHVLQPLIDTPFQGGPATWHEDIPLVLERHGFAEETHWLIAYSPVPDESVPSGIGGVLATVHETTARVVGERRLRTLRGLAGRTSEEARSAEVACETAARTLAENPHDLPFVLLYLLDGEGRATLAGLTGLEPDTPASPASVDSRRSDGPWPFRQVVETGQAVEVGDLERKLGPLPGGAWPESPERAVVLPMARPGQSRLAGFVVAGACPRLRFDDEYRGFFDLLAGHVATAVANARAHEEEQRRAEALAELDRVKTAFFSNVSHEFRTPLTLMLGPVEDLLGSRDGLSPAAAGLLEVVNRNGLRLLRLVNTLLDFSRIEAGRARAAFGPTDLGSLTGELASVFRSACERAGVRLTVDCPPSSEPVFVDREMWEKIVLNLLSNALKFTFEGEIAVSLGTSGTAAELRVRDTGTGIPAEELPRLFERFHRVRGAQGRTHEGSGIGLALVQELVRLHGGSVGVESAVGQGTTFTVTVPLGSAHLPHDQIEEGRDGAPSAAGASPFVEEALRWLPDDAQSDAHGPELAILPEPLPAPARWQGGSDDRPRVLVADDNADMRQYVTRLLAEHFRVEAVPDGAAALAAARERLPDLILTDVMMPRLDGFGLLAALRGEPATRDLPVIVLSARAGEESRVEGMAAGADDYLVKPFSARELLARVSAHVRMARMRREAGEALRQSHDRFAVLFDAAPLGMCLVDAELRLLQVNPRARPAPDRPDWIGKDLAEVLRDLVPRPEADELVERFRDTLATGQPYSSPEYRVERLDRRATEYYELQVSRIPLPGGGQGAVCYFNDVTRHVQARSELAEADRRKTEFLAMLAHELRNPLAPIRNTVEILRRSPDHGQDVKPAIEMMRRQVGHIVRLVDDLLDVSRISQGKIQLRREPLELAPILLQAVEAARPLCESSRHELTVTLPPQAIYLDADPIRLAQVVGNLLNNACKFTAAGGRIRLTVERDGAQALIRVQDTGIGIAPQQLGRIFEMFAQVDTSREHSRDGLGLGLTLVKNLVEMHGGTVEARSAGVGRGSEFAVRLPLLSEPPPLPGEPSGARPVALVSRRILVVDDNRDAADSLAMLLVQRGHEVHTAHDGLEAVEAAARLRPDVILLDIGLPGLDGYGAALRIREQQRDERPVLVALTGWGQDEDRRRAAEAGFDAHLVKPVDFAALTQLLADSRAG